MTIKELEKDLNSRGGNLSGIYTITRKSDGKIYIGQSECITKRIIQHINNIRETNSDKIDGAIQKDGIDAFTYEVEMYAPDLNTEQLWAMEHFCIKKYNSNVIGFNRTKGNHIGKYDHYQYSKKRHEISDELIKLISNHFGLEYAGKTVLLIGVFTDTFIKHIEFNNGKVVKLSQAFDTDEETGEYILNELKEEKIMNRKFDLIIANPPYGKIGANITKTIIDNIDYNEYINLLPANDYNRNTTKDLYKYVELDTMKPIIKGFADASVTTHMAKISKKQRRYISFEEFQIENYIDNSLTKYFYELRNRKHYAIDSATCPYWHNGPENISNKKVFILGERDISSGRFPVNTNSVIYKWNVEKTAGPADLHIATNDQLSQIICQFDTEEECANFTNFCYSNTKFMNKLFKAVNADKMKVLYKVFPKVDWTRSWTVEEILKEYGYTQKEIEEVINDLVNYKGMED
jgi:group I intron endonuclease